MAVETSGASGLTISVILCAYTEKRWDDLQEAVASVKNNHRTALETIVVVDHNPALFTMVRQDLDGVIAIENRNARGLSGARNSAIEIARGDLLAFLDDDAAASPDWLAVLAQAYADAAVMGVGGAIQPNWLNGRPAWFPREFDWVVGCTYLGMPEAAAPVRNLIGANMSFRREVFASVGDFSTGMGRVGTYPAGCEETELCIRARQNLPGTRILYIPQAWVRHRVPPNRATWSYFRARCFAEGRSKALVAQLVGAQDGLSSERSYTVRTLPRGIARGFADFVRHADASGLARALVMIAGVWITALGYLSGILTRPRQAVPAPAAMIANPPHKMRVLIVTPRFLPFTGGVENHVYETARRMARDGLDVTVLTADPTRTLPAKETIDGISVERVPAWPSNRDYYFAPRLYRRVQRGDWDLVHIQSYHTLTQPLAMLAAARAKIPYVVTFHGGGHSSALRNRLRRLQRWLLRPLLRRAARLIAVARFEIRAYGEELGLPPERFALIPNGCDLPPAPQDVVKDPAPLIIAVGRLEAYKGHQRILAALPDVLKARPTARLWIVGAGPYESQLHALAAQLGVTEAVRIQAIPPGERAAMSAALAPASLFVLLSDFETHPISALEALSLGIPALVSHTSGLAELAEQGYAASLPLTSTPPQVAKAILAQLDHPQLPTHLDLPTWEDCYYNLVALYSEVLLAKGRYAHSHVVPVLSPHSGGH